MGDVAVEVALHVRAERAEGPLWDAPTARLWWVDITGQQVHCYDPESGADCSWPVSGPPGGVVLDTDGHPVIAMPDGLVVLDRASGSTELLMSSGGRLYLADTGIGERTTPPGRGCSGTGIEARIAEATAGRPGGAGPTCSGAGETTDILDAVDDLEGTSAADGLYGGPGANQLLGRAGADTFYGREGTDFLQTSSGDLDPTIICDADADTA